MAVASRHILAQGPTLATLAEVAATALLPLPKRRSSVAIGEDVNATLAPLDPNLVRDYVRHVGGDPSAYRDRIPPHLFPQWSFPILARAMRGLPYPMHNMVNAGCRLEIQGPLPAGEPLLVAGRLAEVDEQGHRVILKQRVATGPKSHPEAVVATVTAMVRLRKPEQPRSSSKPKARVPADAEEVATLRINTGAGLDFAKLTGDFNPVHWVAPYARAAGFRGTILHGFSTFARTYEGIVRNVFAGSTQAMTVLDARFTRPLVLPARPSLYLHEGPQPGLVGVSLGDAPSGPAYLQGHYDTRR